MFSRALYSATRAATQILLRASGTDKYIHCDLVPVKCTAIFRAKNCACVCVRLCVRLCAEAKGQGHTPNH